LQNIDKFLVKNRFAGSLKLYAAHASVQQNMAKRLINTIAAHPAVQRQFDTVLEFGCGSGLMTKEIAAHLKYQQLFVNDLVPECKPFIEAITPCKFLPGDIEHIIIPSGMDMIISNATLQWLINPKQALEKFAAALNPGGILAVTTFGADNLHEIAALTGSKLQYFAITEWHKMLHQHFNVIEFSEHFEKLVFISPLAALEHLRHTGVTGVKQPQVWTKAMLHNFVRDYVARYSVDGGIALTYHPIQFIATKKI
jgi:malonyl-CoA O-methyltransferase